MVTALALLFEKIYLPANIEAVCNFARSFRLELPDTYERGEVRIEAVDTNDNPLEDLTPQQRETALTYLKWCAGFAVHHSPLYGPVFETNSFDGGDPISVELVRQGGPGELNAYRVSTKPILMKGGDDETLPDLIEQGYVPILGKVGDLERLYERVDARSAKNLAGLLAMRAVEMILPSTRSAVPEVVLEARDKLKDHLPPFWAAMFRLTVQLRSLIAEATPAEIMMREAETIVDTVVRPPLIDLKHKMERERRQWFYRILSPVCQQLRLMIGNPPLTQQQLIASGLVLASEVAVSASDQLRSIAALQHEAGLTFLLELDKLVAGDKLV